MCHLCLAWNPGLSFAATFADSVDISAKSQWPETLGGLGENLEGAPVVFTLQQIIAQLQTQWGGAQEGSYRRWGLTDISYSTPDVLPTNVAGYTPTETGLVTMTAVQKSWVGKSFELWDDLIATNLNDAGNSASVNITFNYAAGTFGGGTYSRAFLDSVKNSIYPVVADQIWANSNWSSHDQDSDFFFGGYGIATFIHEIGHALGLSHPGTYNAGSGGTITYASNAEYILDNRQYTVMSYFGGYNQLTNNWQQDGTILSYLYPNTPMAHDIAAIQNIFGPDLSTRTENTVYGFNSTAGKDVFDFTINQKPIIAIWDAAGFDTIDLSGFLQSQIISLVDGTYSSVGGMKDNLAIAFNTEIEAVIGGSGVDTISGNASANVINGGAGNDTISGAAGNDTLIGGADNDATTGGGGYDRVVFDLARSAAIIANNPNGTKTITAGGFTDTLSGVELAQFSDGTLVSLQERTNKADLSADGRSDVVLRNSGDGSVYVWEVNGTSLSGGGYFGWTPGAAWKARGTGDFNGDGKSDVLLQNSSDGTCYIWLSNGVGSGVSGTSGYAGYTPGANWEAKGTGDFNGDGKSDILLQNSNDGTCYIWNLDGTTVISQGYAGYTPGANWVAKGTGDFNGDGKSDILLQNSNDGTCYIWNLDGTTVISQGYAGYTPGANWVAKGTGDFNGDGKSDILLQNSNDGTCYIWNLDGTTLISQGYAGYTPGANWEAKGTGDFNGDGKSDILLQNSNDGTCYIWNLDGTTVISQGYAGYTPGAQWEAVA